VIIFLHIPKAAGTSLYEIIRREYRGRNIRVVQGSQEGIEGFKGEPEADRHAVDVLMGHVYYGIHRHLRAPASYMTMLREPVDRLVSQYAFVRQEPAHHLHSRVVDGGLSLAEFASMNIESDNGQVRRLNELGYWQLPLGRVTQGMLDAAKRRLREDIRVFGLSERFDDSLRLFRRALGWRSVEQPRANVTRSRPRVEELSEKDLAAVREQCRFDIELYKFAGELFEERLEAIEAGSEAAAASGGGDGPRGYTFRP